MELRICLPFVLLLGSAVAQVTNSATFQANANAIFGGAGPKKNSNTNLPAVAPQNINQRATSDDFSCTTTEGLDGECVRYYLCDVTSNQIKTDGVGLIDIRNTDDCAHYLDICCALGSKRAPEDPVTPKPTLQETQRTGCGWANPKGKMLRTTGETDGETKFAEFPWMVALLVSRDGQNTYLGGGSLIHPRVVLTTAHRIEQMGQGAQFVIRAGEWDTSTEKEPYPFQERNVQKAILHKDYMPGILYYDVAVLILESPIDPAPHIGYACLPSPGVQADPGTRCFATGWGKDKFEGGSFQTLLKKIELPIVDKKQCQRMLRKTRLGRLFQLHHSFMCAGGEPGKDTCKGDGGSPLVCPILGEQDRYVQQGLVAWGIGCGEDGTPGVYADAAEVRAWIDNELVRENIRDLEYANY